MAYADTRYHIHLRNEDNTLLTTSSFTLKKEALKEYDRLKTLTPEQITEEFGFNDDVQATVMELYDYARYDLDWRMVKSYDFERGEDYIAQTKSL